MDLEVLKNVYMNSSYPENIILVHKDNFIHGVRIQTISHSLVIVCPAALKTRSEGTSVAGIARYIFARAAKRGNLCEICCR